MVTRSASLSDKIADTAVALTIRMVSPTPKKSKYSRISIRRGQAISPIDDSLLAPNEAGLALASGGGRFSRGFKNPHNGG